ncbi:MAG TPA: ribosome biogenesis GTP-binding protein YihA/YsxC [Steroidobacteraceae bacterium]|nr:ribosome biogenesis GTP-binding protein YihA/YsxC [Steroidobacteraceae bacterium]
MAAFPNAKFLVSAAAPGQFPPDQGVEVAFAGRSNSGKSSAINAIVGRQGLARTSKTPGRTRLINFFELSARERIVDLPGYGYASAPESERRTWPRLIEALRERAALKGLFVIVDARRGIGEGDEALLEWALPRQRVHVLLSKADKLSRNEGRQVLAAAAQSLQGRATVQLFSAHARAGLEEAQKVLKGWLGGKEKTPMTSGEATGAD